MHASKQQPYSEPGLRSFANAQEVWDYYKDKGTADERSRLLKMLGLPAGDETEEAPLRRRA